MRRSTRASEAASVMVPTRPTYISSISWLEGGNCAVTPVDRPTAPRADHLEDHLVGRQVAAVQQHHGAQRRRSPGCSTRTSPVPASPAPAALLLPHRVSLACSDQCGGSRQRARGSCITGKPMPPTAIHHRRQQHPGIGGVAHQAVFTDREAGVVEGRTAWKSPLQADSPQGSPWPRWLAAQAAQNQVAEHWTAVVLDHRRVSRSAQVCTGASRLSMPIMSWPSSSQAARCASRSKRSRP